MIQFQMIILIHTLHKKQKTPEEHLHLLKNTPENSYRPLSYKTSFMV